MNPTEELFAIAAVWTLLAVGVSMLFKSWRHRAIFVGVVVAIPFWELPYGYYNFREQCVEHGQLRTTEKISKQTAVCVTHLDSGLFAGLVAAGFSRIELIGQSDNPERDAKSGRVFRVSSSEMNSEYCLDSRLGREMPWRILRNDRLVIGRSDKREAARQSDILWEGMKWQEAARPILGIGGVCDSNPSLLWRLLIEGGQ